MVSLSLLNNIAILIPHRNTPTLRRVTLLRARQFMLCPQATCNKDLPLVMSHLRSPLEHQTPVKKQVASVLTRSRTRQLFLRQTLHRLLRFLNKDLLHLTASLSTRILTPLS